MYLNVENVHVQAGRRSLLQNVSFQIEPGTIVGLVGPNGAGKTTLMKTILGVQKFTGTIEIDGVPVSLTNHQAIRKVGALIENPAIYPYLSGRQNLKLYTDDQANLNELITRLEMTEYIDRKSSHYSLGMKQKLGIALAFLNHPDMIILDEPMNGLDIEATIILRKLIQDYAAQGAAILISSHVLTELEKVLTDIILINHGRVTLKQSIEQFEATSQQQTYLATSDLTATQQVLNAAGIDFTTAPAGVQIKQDDLAPVQKLLQQHEIIVLEMRPVAADFEQLVVNSLDQEV
jgi:ABC-2 type transport system ATP-binding protein